MAKKPADTEALEIVVFPEAEAMMQKASTDLVATTIGTREHLEQLKATYGALVVNGIEDMAGYKVVVEGISKLKKIRTGIEKRRKELTEPALKFQRDLKAIADEITDEITPLEKRLAEEKARIDDAKETARRAEFQRRVTLLSENAWQLVGGFYVCGALQIHPDQIGTMDEAQLEFYINEGQKEIQRQKAEAERKEAEEAQRRADEERLKAEREAIAKEREELAKMKAELEAQKKALEQTYETVVQPEPVPIQDQGKRLQERAERLLKNGMKRGADGFTAGKMSISNTGLMGLSDEEFEKFETQLIAYMTVPVDPMGTQKATFKAPENWKPVANGGGAPVQPAQQPQPAQAPVQEETATWHARQTETVAFQMGFDNFRMLILELLNDPTPMKRSDLINWVKNVHPRR